MTTSFPDCTLPAVGTIALAVPSFDGDAVTIDTSGLPNPYTFVPVGDGPEVVVPDLPGAFSYTEPADPALIDVHIPTFDPLPTVGTSAAIPTYSVPDPTHVLTWTRDAFDESRLADINTHVDRVRNGDFSIGADVWRQIYERAAQTIRREGQASAHKARSQWANLGWTMPGGAALAGELSAARSTMEALSKHAMDVATQEATQKDEQVWKAIAENLKLEAKLFDINQAANDQTLKYALALQDASLATHKALVDAFNAQLAKANADIQLVGMQLEAQKTELQNRKLALDAAVVEGEVNKVHAEVYRAQWEGVKAAADAYSAEVRAIGENVQAQKTAIEAHGLKVAQKKIEVDSWAAQMDGYGKKMQAESVKVDYFGQIVNQYAARINAYDVEVRALETVERNKSAMAQAAAACSGAAASWKKAEVDEAIGNLEHTLGIARVAVDQYLADTKNKEVDNDNAIEWKKISDAWSIDTNKLQIARDENAIRGALGYAGFTNNLDVENVRGGFATTVAGINKDSAYATTVLDTQARRDTAQVDATARSTVATIGATATTTAACTSATASVTSANIDAATRTNTTNAENATRVAIANATNATQVSTSNAEQATRVAIAYATAQAQLNAAAISAEAQLGAAEANKEHHSYSESRTQTLGVNSIKNYQHTQSSANNSHSTQSCSDEVKYIKNVTES